MSEVQNDWVSAALLPLEIKGYITYLRSRLHLTKAWSYIAWAWHVLIHVKDVVFLQYNAKPMRLRKGGKVTANQWGRSFAIALRELSDWNPAECWEALTKGLCKRISNSCFWTSITATLIAQHSLLIWVADSFRASWTPSDLWIHVCAAKPPWPTKLLKVATKSVLPLAATFLYIPAPRWCPGKAGNLPSWCIFQTFSPVVCQWYHTFFQGVQIGRIRKSARSLEATERSLQLQKPLQLCFFCINLRECLLFSFSGKIFENCPEFEKQEA